MLRAGIASSSFANARPAYRPARREKTPIIRDILLIHCIKRSGSDTVAPGRALFAHKDAYRGSLGEIVVRVNSSDVTFEV